MLDSNTWNHLTVWKHLQYLIALKQICSYFLKKGNYVLTIHLQIICIYPFNWRGGPSGVMVKTMDCGIVVSEFVLQTRYYVHFRANTLGKGMNLLILPAMG